MGQDKGEMGQDEDEQTGGAGLGNGGRDWGREETLKAQAERWEDQERRAGSSTEGQRRGPGAGLERRKSELGPWGVWPGAGAKPQGGTPDNGGSEVGDAGPGAGA